MFAPNIEQLLAKHLPAAEQHLRPMLQRAFADCFSHALPPANAQPVAWSLCVDLTGGDSDLAAGVLWTPAACSVLGRPANAFQAAADTATAAPLPPGLRAVVWPVVAVGRGDAASTASTRPPIECRQTWMVDGQPVPGYLNQTCQGAMAGTYVDGSDIVRGNASTGTVQLAPLAPVQLRSGQRLSVAVKNNLAAGETAIVWCVVRGWAWPSAS